MAGRGGKTPGAGRKLGVPNKATGEIKALAREFGAPAITRLAQLSGLLADHTGADSEAAQIAAIKELLDRGYGKATQPLSGDNTAPPVAIEFTWADAIPATDTPSQVDNIAIVWADTISDC